MKKSVKLNKQLSSSKVYPRLSELVSNGVYSISDVKHLRLILKYTVYSFFCLSTTLFDFIVKAYHIQEVVLTQDRK